MRLIDADALEPDADYYEGDYWAVSIVQIHNAPTIEPRKKGHWIKISPANIYECSECGKNVMTDDISAYDFCHGCGAEMTEGEE